MKIRKNIFLFLVLNFFVLVFANSQDFVREFYWTKITLDFQTQNKLIVGSTVYLKENCNIHSTRTISPFYTLKEVIGPRAQDSDYIYEIKARNFFTGNEITLSISGKCFLDQRGPYVNFSSSAGKTYKTSRNEIFCNKSTKLKFFYEDEFGLNVKKYFLFVNDKVISSNNCGASGSLEYDLTDEGIYQIEFYCVDQLGNESSRIKKTVIIDKQNPKFSEIICNENDDWLNKNLNFKLYFEDEFSGINLSSLKYKLASEDNFKTLNNKTELEISTEGKYEIQFYVEDLCGNSCVSEIFKKNLDFTSPKIEYLSFDKNEPKWTNKKNHKFNFTDDFSGIKFSSIKSDDKKFENASEISFEDEGEKTIELFAQDFAGNQICEKVILKTDFTAPEIKDLNKISDFKFLPIEVSDNLSGVNFESIKWKTSKKDWTYGNKIELDEGEQEIFIYAEDYAGNFSLKNQKIKYCSKAPELECSIDNFVNKNLLELKNFSVNFEDYNNVNLTFFLDDSKINLIEEDKTLLLNLENLEDGKHVLKIIADASNGRISELKKEFFLDRIKPKIKNIFVSNFNKTLNEKDFADFKTENNNIIFNLKIDVEKENFSLPCSKEIFLYNLNDSSWKKSDDSKFEITEFIHGKNILRIKILDEAENESEETKFSLFTDTIKTSPVKIESFLRNKNSVKFNLLCGQSSSYGFKEIKCEYIQIQKNENDNYKILFDLQNQNVKTCSVNCDLFSEILIEDLDFSDLEKNYVFKFYSVNKSNLKSEDLFFVLKNDYIECFQENENSVLINFNEQINNFSGELNLKNDFENFKINELEAGEFYLENSNLSNSKINFISYKTDKLELEKDILISSKNADDLQFDFPNDLFSSKDVKINNEKILVKNNLLNFNQYIQGDIFLKLKDLKTSESDFYVFDKSKDEFAISLTKNSIFELTICFEDFYKNNFQYKICFPQVSNESFDFSNFSYVCNEESPYFSKTVEFKNSYFENEKINYGKTFDCKYSLKNFLSIENENNENYDLEIFDAQTNNNLDKIIFNNENSNLTFKLKNFENLKIKSAQAFCVSEKFINIPNGELFLYKNKISFDFLNIEFKNFVKLNSSVLKNRNTNNNFFTNYFKFLNVENLKIKNNILSIENNSVLKLENLKLYEQEKNLNLKQVEQIYLDECSLDLNGNLLFAECQPENLYLKIEENEFKIYDLQFVDQCILFKKLIFAAKLNNQTYNFEIKNLIFDDETQKFNSENSEINVFDENGEKITELKINGFCLDFTKIYFLQNGKLNCSGTYIFGDDEIIFDNIEIGKDNIKTDYVDLNNANFSLYGYELKINECLIKNENNILCFYVKKGFLKFYNQNINLKDFKFYYENTCKALVPFILKEKFELDTGFGKNIELTKLLIDEQGIFGDCSVNIKNQKINFENVSFSNGKISASNNKISKLNLFAYDFTVSEMFFDGKEILLSGGKINLGKLNLEIKFQSLKFNYENITSFNFEDFEEYEIFYNNWNIFISKVKWDKFLSFEAYIYQEFENSNLNINFKNLIYNGETEKFIFDSYISDDSYLYLNDYLFESNDVSYDEVKNVFVLSDSFYKTGKNKNLNLGNIFFYSNGKFFYEAKNQNQKIEIKNYEIICQEIKIEENLIIKGFLNINKIDLFSKDSLEIILTEYNEIEILNQNVNVDFVYNDFKINAYLNNLVNSKINLKNCVTNIFGQDIVLGDFILNEDFSLANQALHEQNIFVDENFSDKIVETNFNKNGLFGKLRKDEKTFLNDSVFFENVQITADNQIRIFHKIKNYEIKNDLFSLKVGKLGFNNEEFTFENSYFSIHGFDEDIVIHVDYFVLNKNGSFSIDKAAINPFKLFGFSILIEQLDFTNEFIKFSGLAVLPFEFPGILSGLSIKISDVKINFGKGIENFNISLDCDYSLNLFGEWNINFKNIGFVLDDKNTKLNLNKCSLIFPEELKITEVQFNSISIDLLTFKFDFENINFLTEFNFSFMNMNFFVNQIRISSDYDIEILSSVFFEGSDLPEIIKNTKFENIKLCFSKDGRIKDFSLSANNISGKIFKNNEIMYLKSGSISLVKDEDYILRLAGSIYFDDKESGILNELELGIRNFEYNISKNVLQNFCADANNLNFNFSGIEFSDIEAVFNYSLQSENFIDLSGSLILPEYLPPEISGSKIEFEELLIDENNKIKKCELNYKNKNQINIFAGIFLEDFYLNFSLNENTPQFLLSGNILFNEDLFPQFISNIKTYGEVLFTKNGIVSCVANSVLDDTVIFNSFTTKNAQLKIEKKSGQDFVLSINGELCLLKNDDFNFGNLNFKIHNFTYALNGELLNFSCSTNAEDLNVFDCVNIKNSSLALNYFDKDFILNCAGEISLDAKNIPQIFRNVNFQLSDFEYSFSKGLKNFEVSTGNSTEFKLTEDLNICVDSINFNKSGMKVSAKAKTNNLSCLKSGTFVLEDLTYDWNGKLTNINAGLENIKIEFLNFESSLEKLSVYKNQNDKIILELHQIQINLKNELSKYGSNYLYIDNLKFVDGEIQLSSNIETIKLNICGFGIFLENFKIDKSKKEFVFSKVTLQMPELLNNSSINLESVRINKKYGLVFSSAEFILPEFTIGKDIMFKNIYAGFFMTEGSFEIRGSGAISIPNLGELEASISFTNDTNKYLLGIKKAYFSFETKKIGIPLGQTGLYINGVRGGISYGIDNSVNQEIKNYFTDGFTLQLGLTVYDRTKQLVQIKGDLWIDIQNLSFAITGDASVLKGSFNLTGNAQAVLSKYGFSTSMYVNITFVKGSIQLNIFSIDGNIKFSGNAQVQFRVKKGEVYSKSFKIFKKRIDINIPAEDKYFASFGAEFGDFNNNERGFKAYINVPCFGNLGVFVSSNNLKLGNLDNISLLKMPSKSVSKNIKSSSLNKSRRNNKLFAGNLNVNQNPKKLKNISFICVYSDICPEFIFELNNEYKFVSSEIEKFEIPNCTIFKINDVNDGEWTYFTKSEESSFEIEILKNYYEDKPCTNKIYIADDVLHIEGFSPNLKDLELLYTNLNKDIYLPLNYFSTDENGFYCADISLQNIENGIYRFAVRSKNYFDDFSETEYINEIFHLQHNIKKLNTINAVFIDYNNNQFDITWNHEIENLISAYELEYYFDDAADNTKKLNVGNINKYLLSNLQNNKKLNFRIRVYYENLKSPYSKWYSYEIVEEKKSFMCKSLNPIEIHIGKTCDFEIQIENLFDFENEVFSAELKKLYNASEIETNDISIFFKDNFLNEKNKNHLKGNICIAENCKAGKYFAELRIFTLNNSLYESFVKCEINVLNPDLKISNVYPEILNSNTKEIEVFGEGFVEACKYYFNGNEIPVCDKNYFKNHKILSVENLKIKNQNELKIKSLDKKEVSYILYKETLSAEAEIKEIYVRNSFSYSVPIFVKNYNEENLKFVCDEESINLFPEYSNLKNSFIELNFQISNNAEFDSCFIKLLSEDSELCKIKIIKNKSDAECEIENLFPKICNLDKYNVYCNQEVEVYGENFTKNSLLYVDNQKIDFDLISNNKLKFIVDNKISSGKLYVKNGELKSNSVELTIKTKELEIYASSYKIYLKENENYDLKLICKNIESSTEILIETDTLEYALSQNFINEDSVVNLKIKFKENLVNMENKLKITARTKNQNKSLEISVIKVDVPKIIFDDEIEIKKNENFNFKIKTENISCEKIFSIINGRLPENVFIDNDGNISGCPEKVGEYLLEVQVKNEIICVSKKIKIKVYDDFWTSSLNLVNKNNFLNEKFTNEFLVEKKETLQEHYSNLLCYDSYLYIYSDKSILIKDKNFKNVNKIYFDDCIKEISVAGNYIIVVFAKNKIQIYNRFNFKKVHETYSEKYFIIKDEIYFIDSLLDNNIKIYDLFSFELVENLNVETKNLKNIIVNKSEKFFQYDYKITNAKTEIFLSSEKILKSILFNEYLYILTESQLLFYNTNLNKTEKILSFKNLALNSLDFSVSDNLIILKLGSEIFCYNLNTFEENWNLKNVNKYVLTNNQILILNEENNFASHNLFNSNKILSYEKNCKGFTLYEEKIYLLNQENELLKLDGKNNPNPPKLELDFTCEKKSDSSAWYSGSYTLKLNSFDAETYVSKIFYSFDDENYKLYDDKIELNQGVNKIFAYGIDSEGKKSEVYVFEIKYDSESPRTKILNEEKLGSWFSKNVKLNFSAFDKSSGIKNIYVNQKKLKRNSVYITQEGSTDIYFYSEDNAGNVEKIHKVTVKIDYFNPEVFISYVKNESDYYFELKAFDRGSGIKQIEFSINDSPINIYQEKIKLNLKSINKIKYRALDYSGKYSDWKYEYIGRNLIYFKHDVKIFLNKSHISKDNFVFLDLPFNFRKKIISYKNLLSFDFVEKNKNLRVVNYPIGFRRKKNNVLEFKNIKNQKIYFLSDFEMKNESLNFCGKTKSQKLKQEKFVYKVDSEIIDEFSFLIDFGNIPIIMLE